jgi:hypothetical protein
MKMKKKFINTIASMPLLFALLKSLLGGIVYAVAVFFTSKKLKKWNEEKSSPP